MPRRVLVAALIVALAAGIAFQTNTNPTPATAVAAGDRLGRVPARPPLTADAGSGQGEADVVTTAPAQADPAAEFDLAAVPVGASDPAGLAEQITVAEHAIRAPAPTPDELAYFGHLQQVAYRTLADRPDWDSAVSAALPSDLRPVMAANVAAGRELARPQFRPQTKLPAWRIVDPLPASQLRAYYEEGEATFGVPWEYLAAVNLTETRMGRIRGLSSAGAQGPMQFIPSTWARYGQGDINDPHDAILGAARYLAANGGADGNLANALLRYNPAQWYVDAVTTYAEQMVTDERAFLGYHAWQVYYATSLGDVLLPVGYESSERRPVTPADLG